MTISKNNQLFTLATDFMPGRSRGTHRADNPPKAVQLTLLQVRYYQRLIFCEDYFSVSPTLPAYHTAKSPSKPLRPHY